MNKVIRQGENLRINGQNIYAGADTVVYWNSIHVDNLAAITSPPSNNSISVMVPAGLQDTNKVILCNKVGCFTGAQEYDYIGFPSIDSISHLSRDWGKTVTLRGNHLKDVTGVSLESAVGRTYTASFDMPSKRSLTFYMPDDFTTGNINLFSRVGSTTSSQMVTGIVPPIEGKIVGDGTNYYGDRITVQGRALHKVNRIKFEGLNQLLYTNSADITHAGSTGLFFNLPQGVRDETTVYLQNQSGQFINNVYNSTVYEEFGVYPIDVSSPYIQSSDKTYGKHNEDVLISGINLNNSKILFLNYNNKYDQATLVNSGEYYKTVKIPKNIKSDRIVASGYQNSCSGLSYSNFIFYPLPTIDSVSSNNLTVGSVVTINASNAFEIFGAVGITGANLVKSGAYEIEYISNQQNTSEANYYFESMTLDNSSVASDPSTGSTVISATINASFIGEGHPFLISRSQIQGEASISQLKNNINLYNIKSVIPSVTGQKITISGKKPVVTSLSLNRASISGDLSISGNYFLGATGVQLSGMNQVTKISQDKFINYNNSLTRGIAVSDTGTASSYEQRHSISVNTLDFGFTKKSGEFKILTPYHE
tara:strand:- start:3184 stop:4962 length:1779 start_codon:yes stop_codon:yes gene_type:complete